LRFAAPIAPTTINRTINDGQIDRICAQAQPYWYEILTNSLSGATLSTLDAIEAQLEQVEAALTISKLSALDPRTTEDCLFLDVATPVEAFKTKRSVPVVVWIYGGGYVSGSKTSQGDAASLIAKAKEDCGEGVVWVAMNYRNGLFVGIPYFSKLIKLTDTGLDVWREFHRGWRCRQCRAL
jgi:acetyl esterase/lipase